MDRRDVRFCPGRGFAAEPGLPPDLYHRWFSGGGCRTVHDPDPGGSGQEFPFLPPLPDEQTFTSHAAVLSFNGGQGLRFITHTNESMQPIDNRSIFYTFQGLTDDGLYWVAVTLPIRSPILPEAVDFPPPPKGYSDENWFENYDMYVSEVKETLEAQSSDSFFPTMDDLDRLVQSITIR